MDIKYHGVKRHGIIRPYSWHGNGVSVMMEQTNAFELKKSDGRYRLRQAAGLYWLLDMEQKGMPYKNPLPLNEMGASIFQMMVRGMEQGEIADVISKEYQVERELALQDIIQFKNQLQEQGIDV